MTASVTTIQIENYLRNHNAELKGNLIRNGWTCTKSGFKYGLTAVPTWSVEYTYDVDKDGDFQRGIGSLICYTKYYYRAYADIKRVTNPEDPEDEWVWEDDTVYGDWLSFTTDAEATVKTIIVTNVTKEIGFNNSAKFIGYIEDDADGNVSQRGFKYGLTEADTYSKSEMAGAEGTYSLIETDMAGDTDFYVRAFAVTPTGTYYDEVQYVKFSTKVLYPSIYILTYDWYDIKFYLISYDYNGNIYNAWELTGEYWDANCICVDEDGNTYTIMDEITLIKRNKNGAVVGTTGVGGVVYSIALKPNGYLVVRGRSGDMQYLQRRDPDTLDIVGSSWIIKWSSDPNAYTGLAIDKDGYIYIIDILDNVLEKWKIEISLEDDNITTSEVHTDTNIIDLNIDVATGTKIWFWSDDTLPNPLNDTDDYWAIRTSENHIKVALSKANAIAGIAIDITDVGVGVHDMGTYGTEKIAEVSLSGVYVGTANYLAIAGDLIYSNEYGEQGWTIPTSLGEAPAEWSPSNLTFVKSLGFFGSKFIISGINAEGKHVISFYDSAKNYLKEAELSVEVDMYSLSGGTPGATLITLSAEHVKTFTSTVLRGEITENAKFLTSRGFEYLIQDAEPAEGYEGTELLEEPEWVPFSNEEYTLRDETLYNLDDEKEDWEAEIIWWFRAIGYIGIYKSYGEWMKNVPTVTTGDMTAQLVLNSIPMILAGGELLDKGADASSYWKPYNRVTRTGFRIYKEYKGTLHEADEYIWMGNYGRFYVIGEMEEHTILGGPSGYEIVDYYWTGTFYRDSLWPKSDTPGNFDVGVYEYQLGGGAVFGEGFGIYLKANDTYGIQAIAVNDLGKGFGEIVEVTTLDGVYISGTSEPGIYIPGETVIGTYTPGITVVVTDDQIDSTKFEKTVTLLAVPSGCTVTRIGIRLGRTKNCNELHYFQDGSFGTGGSFTFMVELEPNETYYIMPYIVIDYGDYEEEILGMIGYTDPDKEAEYLSKYPVEVTDDIEEDDFGNTTAEAGEVNYNYRLIKKAINCEKIGSQGIIDNNGRRRSHTITNHLIQDKSTCGIIITDYLDKFQNIKLKIAIDIDMPIPFVEEDVILLGDGKTLYKTDTQGAITFKADGTGELLQQPFILAKIRKIGATFISGGSTMIPIELEV